MFFFSGGHVLVVDFGTLSVESEIQEKPDNPRVTTFKLSIRLLDVIMHLMPKLNVSAL